MKVLHKNNFYCWSQFNEDRNIDFHSYLWVRDEGNVAFVVEGDTLITGDLIRAHAGGTLCLLPEAKLQDLNDAIASVKKMASIGGIKVILPGDGWPVFRDGESVLSELVTSL